MASGHHTLQPLGRAVISVEGQRDSRWDDGGRGGYRIEGIMKGTWVCT